VLLKARRIEKVVIARVWGAVMVFAFENRLRNAAGEGETFVSALVVFAGGAGYLPTGEISDQIAIFIFEDAFHTHYLSNLERPLGGR
jgi:hypothetical protein